jgi:hypothetical protein
MWPPPAEIIFWHLSKNTFFPNSIIVLVYWLSKSYLLISTCAKTRISIRGTRPTLSFGISFGSGSGAGLIIGFLYLTPHLEPKKSIFKSKK